MLSPLNRTDLQEFEDLDEIIARHIQPMAAHARDVLHFRYFVETSASAAESKAEIERQLLDEKNRNGNRVP